MVSTVLWIFGICFFGSIFSSLWINYAESRFKAISVTCNDRGETVSKNIMKNNGFYGKCKIVDSEDYSVADLDLSDCFLIESNKIVLTKDVFYESTIWSTAVAAHEASHAIQYNAKNKHTVTQAKKFSNLSGMLFLIGLLCGILAMLSWSTFLFILMMSLIALVLVCQLVTLGIEMNASNMAMCFLRESGNYSDEEIFQIRHALNAAAFTYLSALFSTVLLLFSVLASIKNDD